MRVQTSVRADAVRQTARHTLFVEGANDDAFDPTVLERLLPMIRVRPLGPSMHIRAAAEAMHAHHPDYYFIVDRDFHDDAIVDRSWQRFPDPVFSNILIWRRRELENYFIDPDYLQKSEFLACSRDELREYIRTCCKERLYLEVANAVLITIRESAKRKWIDVFTTPADFLDRDAALRLLKTRPELSAWCERMNRCMQAPAIEAAFDSALRDFTAGDESLQFGRGSWLHRVGGKKVFANVVNRYCRVRSLGGEEIRGPEANKAVAKGLLSMALTDQPDDFQQVHAFISAIATS